jgi:hypothetical protein
MKLEPLIRCPGPHGRGCGDDALIEPGKICSPCQQAEARRTRAGVSVSLPGAETPLAKSVQARPGSRQLVEGGCPTFKEAANG